MDHVLQIVGDDIATSILELYITNWVITVPLTFLAFYLIRWYVMKTMPTFVMYHRKGGLVEQHKAKETVKTVEWNVDEKPYYPKPLKGGRPLVALKSCPPEYWVVRGIPRRLFHVIEDGSGRTVAFELTEEHKKQLAENTKSAIKEILKGLPLSEKGKKSWLIERLRIGLLDEEVLTMEYDKAFAGKLVAELKRPRSSRIFDILLGVAFGFILGLIAVSQKWLVIT